MSQSGVILQLAAGLPCLKRGPAKVTLDKLIRHSPMTSQRLAPDLSFPSHKSYVADPRHRAGTDIEAESALVEDDDSGECPALDGGSASIAHVFSTDGPAAAPRREEQLLASWRPPRTTRRDQVGPRDRDYAVCCDWSAPHHAVVPLPWSRFVPPCSIRLLETQKARGVLQVRLKKVSPFANMEVVVHLLRPDKPSLLSPGASFILLGTMPPPPTPSKAPQPSPYTDPVDVRLSHACRRSSGR
ncbi:hypothetical protein HPB47_006454 [Ixodes persulcatus]|uniref:Uncharacterized protein n=1 Tax=Ixodes persulcatus TaxID=34615 RepID=A0AC60PAG3_IXOPE|nr:hypothetical protein HPB47_006454 [Ixodes persulcatus]